MLPRLLPRCGKGGIERGEWGGGGGGKEWRMRVRGDIVSAAQGLLTPSTIAENYRDRSEVHNRVLR